MSQTPQHIEAQFDRLDGTVAVLRFADGQELRVPATALPTAKLGEAVRLSPLLGEAEREALARTVLSQLLGGR